jgi:molecular chaperone DnaK
VPQIEVTFEVDANGIVSVSATDKATGRDQQMRITPTSGLSPDEIDRLIREAESSIETDRRVKEIIAMRNKLEGLVRNTQRSFTEFSASLSSENRREGQQALSEGQSAVQSDNPEEIERAIEGVEQLASQITMAMMNSMGV